MIPPIIGSCALQKSEGRTDLAAEMDNPATGRGSHLRLDLAAILGIEAIEQRQRGGCVVGLFCCQAKPEREVWAVDDRVDLGHKAASGTTETMI